MDMCQLCEKRKAEYEGLICFQCKEEANGIDIMLVVNHKGKPCWLTGELCEQGWREQGSEQGWCSKCNIFLDWRRDIGE